MSHHHFYKDLKRKLEQNFHFHHNQVRSIDGVICNHIQDHQMVQEEAIQLSFQMDFYNQYQVQVKVLQYLKMQKVFFNDQLQLFLEVCRELEGKAP